MLTADEPMVTSVSADVITSKVLRSPSLSIMECLRLRLSEIWILHEESDLNCLYSYTSLEVFRMLTADRIDANISFVDHLVDPIMQSCL
jgi:hypothetical protein